MSDPEPLDLVLFVASPDPWGAHVGLYIGGSAVLHLCKEIGVPVVRLHHEKELIRGYFGPRATACPPH